MQNTIDKSYGIPLYQQLSTDLRARISNGEFSSHGRIPTEKELCEQYNVSRITVRRAVSMLEETGIVHKRQGFGTVYSSEISPNTTPPYVNFSKTCHLHNHTPGAIFHNILIRAASEEEKGLFRDSNLEYVAVLTRIRTTDGRPVLVEKVFMPSNYAPFIVAEPEAPLTEALGKNGIEFFKSSRTVEICFSDEVESKCLNVPLQAPLLLIHEQIFNKDQQLQLLIKNVVSTNDFPYFIS